MALFDISAQAQRLFVAHRFSEQVALDNVAAVAFQLFELALCFNALGDYLAVEKMSHGDNCSDELVVFVVAEGINERLVYFEDVYRELVQITK